MQKEDIRREVRKNYAEIAHRGTSCCEHTTSCCGSSDPALAVSKAIGYTDEELESIPESANLGLGCGNPTALASLTEGETVLDLGSGAGMDCFLAANIVGEKGKVIGVDMTSDMLDRARQNARNGGYENVEFRLGEIENIPAADNSVDVIISNCVINLSTDKKRVFSEAFRVLKPGGRLMVSDIVLLKELPEDIRNSVSAYVGCIAGAMLKDDYLNAIKGAGFPQVEVLEECVFPIDCIISDSSAKLIIEKMGISSREAKDFAASVVSISVRGEKLYKI